MALTSTTSEVLAKLLATENITVYFGHVRTPSFDLEQRILTLPMYTEALSEETQLLFIMHEVGHALITPTDKWTEALEPDTLKKNKIGHGFKDYINIVEDHRVDRSQKNKFPGSRRWYFKGGEHLFNLEFFGTESISKENRDAMPLIDRLNIYSKVGQTVAPTSFSKEEEKFVVMFDGTKTFEDVVETALAIYNYEKNNLNNTKTPKKPQKKSIQEDIQGEPQEDIQEDIQEKEPESKTISTLKKEIEKLVSRETISYYEFPYFINPQKNIVHAQALIAEDFNFVPISTYISEDDLIKHFQPHFNKWIAQKQTYIKMLAKRFELKKNARQSVRTQNNKTGTIDVNKLYGYKYIEEIFKSNTIVPGGKNHGLLFIVDWSASMEYVLDKVIEQIIVLAEFCKRVNIPFEVYAFSNNNKILTKYCEVRNFHTKERLSRKTLRNLGKENYYEVAMCELLSSKMPRKVYSNMLLRLFTSIAVKRRPSPHCSIRPHGFELSGTPLSEAGFWLRSYIPEFKKKHNIDILNTIILTDGGGEPCADNMRKPEISSGYWSHRTGRHIYIDKKTGMQHEIVEEEHEKRLHSSIKELRGMVEMVKKMTNTNIIGYFVGSKPISICYFFDTHRRRALYNEAVSNMRSKGYTILPQTGFDEYFGFLANNMEEDLDIQIDPGLSKKNIMKVVREDKKRKALNKFFVNRFVDLIA